MLASFRNIWRFSVLYVLPIDIICIDNFSFQLDLPSNRNGNQESTLWVKVGRRVRLTVSPVSLSETVVWKMWETWSLTALWASAACYRDSDIFTFITEYTFWVFAPVKTCTLALYVTNVGCGRWMQKFQWSVVPRVLWHRNSQYEVRIQGLGMMSTAVNLKQIWILCDLLTMDMKCEDIT
jgi:hypothetical protein